ncbi:MAG: PAS domain S-box protein [Desulfobacterota bacterium]|nr:PAS domain S-box protein [Thermodesulfobacteriota bacterium]
MEREPAFESLSFAPLYEETKRKLKEVTLLYELTQISHSALSVDQMLGEIVLGLCDFFKFERLAVLLIEEATGRFILHPASVGFSKEEMERYCLGTGKGITGWVAEKGVGLWVQDGQTDSRDFGDRKDVGSEMCVPLLAGGKVIGLLDVQSDKGRAFTEEEFRLFEKVGEHLGQILESAQSEERYRTVVESALDGVLVMGEDHRLTYVNERFAGLVGYEKEELIGLNFLALLDPESQRRWEERALSSSQGPSAASPCELRILRKNGEIRMVEMNATQIRDLHGNQTQIAFLKDITEKRRMEEQLLQAEKLRALGEMVSGVAHDFNNALSIILGNAQLLLLGSKDPEQIHTLKVIERVAKESAQRVRRLQEFTKSQARQDLSRVDLNALVREAVEITQPKWRDEAQRKGLAIEVRTNLGTIPHAAGDISELREVLIHLLLNAIEAMPEGGTIEIQTYHRNGKVYLALSDTGQGMTEEVRKKIFEPFFTTKPFTHSGLGLSMAYGVIKRFGGEIEVMSEPQKGTTFLISLRTDAVANPPEESAEAAMTHRKARILVIEDEPQVREILCRGLSAFQHQVTEAPSGEQGIKLFQEKEFDLVLTDLGMPHLSGWEVCKIIKSLRSDVPVGMITGWGEEIDELKRRESGVDFIISKPFDLSRVLSLVARSIEQNSASSLSKLP